MEERRNECENANGKQDPAWHNRAGDAMNKPVKKLRQAGHANNYQQVAEQAIAQAQGLLLHAGIKAGGEGDIGHFDQQNRESVVTAASQHGGQIYDGAYACAEQGTLPIPAGEGVRNDLPRTAVAAIG